VPEPIIENLKYQIRISEAHVRAGGSGVPAGTEIEVGIYTSDRGLPSNRILSQNVVLSSGINPNATHQITLATPFEFPLAGIYWFSILNKSASTIYLASADPWTPLLGNLIGTGLTITGNPPRGLVGSVPLSSSLPGSLNSRLLDMRNAVATQSSLRLRIASPIYYLAYDVVTTPDGP